ncbi:Maf family protein [Alphaproteobacteria bacterium]|nr:Maf family protein [Alphaproteobacteria bacterium]
MMNKPKIILASGSSARAEMLRGCGLGFDIIPADIDEKKILQDMQSKELKPDQIATALASEKAAAISATNRDALVIGSDQILVCDHRIFSKARDLNEAKDKLKTLRGKTHKLISAACLIQNGEVLWTHTEAANLTMHNFNDEFLDIYCDKAGNALTDCVGSYALEEAGSWLFSKTRGDYFTILGMPLLPLLNYLREEQGIMP